MIGGTVVQKKDSIVWYTILRIFVTSTNIFCVFIVLIEASYFAWAYSTIISSFNMVFCAIALGKKHRYQLASISDTRRPLGRPGIGCFARVVSVRGFAFALPIRPGSRYSAFPAFSRLSPLRCSATSACSTVIQFQLFYANCWPAAVKRFSRSARPTDYCSLVAELAHSPDSRFGVLR